MTVNRQVFIFNETIINIFSNFVGGKRITFNDRVPPWMNVFVQNKIKWKHQIYKTCIYVKLQETTSAVSELICRRKGEYQKSYCL